MEPTNAAVKGNRTGEPFILAPMIGKIRDVANDDAGAPWRPGAILLSRFWESLIPQMDEQRPPARHPIVSENFYPLKISRFQFPRPRGIRVAKDTRSMKTPLLASLLFFGAPLLAAALACESTAKSPSALPPARTATANAPTAQQPAPASAKSTAPASKERESRAARPAFLFM